MAVRQGNDALQLITEHTMRVTERVRPAGRAAARDDRRTRPLRFCPAREAERWGFRPPFPPPRRWSKAVSRGADLVHVGQARVLSENSPQQSAAFGSLRWPPRARGGDDDKICSTRSLYKTSTWCFMSVQRRPAVFLQQHYEPIYFSYT